MVGRDVGGEPCAQVTAEDGQGDQGQRGAPFDIALVEEFEGADQGGGDEFSPTSSSGDTDDIPF